MNKDTFTRETMTAWGRRQAWQGEERTGIVEYLRTYDFDFRCRVEEANRAVEYLRGEDASRFLDDAGLYGLFGVTPADVSFAGRRAWVASLPIKLLDPKHHFDPKKYRAVNRIIGLALSRHAMDCGFSYDEEEREVGAVVDVGSLAIFGGVSEARVRNMLSRGEGGLKKQGPYVTAESASAWLKGRKEFFASIWELPDEAVPEAQSPDFSEEVVFVPVAADESVFRPSLVRGGKFTIGAKGEEIQLSHFDEALAALQKMATPRWRRPNEAGNWGIVSGRDWKRFERSRLMQM